MFSYFNSAYVLYMLTGFVAMLMYAISRTETHQRLCLDNLPKPVTKERKEDPIVDDMLAELFMGGFSGYLIGLIDGSERERLYYQQLLDLVYVRFVKPARHNENPLVVDKDLFVAAITEEIKRQPTTKLQSALEDRLNDLVGYVSESHYYHHTGVFGVRDIYTAMTRSLSLIERYGITSYRANNVP